MSDSGAREAEAPTVSGRGNGGDTASLIRHLNRRGLRLIMFVDLIGLYLVMVATMFVRFSDRWPAYPVPLYLASFGFTAVVFVVTLYFGGLYEREPRLGAPPVLPRAVGLTLAAGGLIALLNLGLTGLARELGLTTERALPLPVVNLVVLIFVGAGVVAVNRRLVHWNRTRREGLPRLLLVGSDESVDLARSHLESNRPQARLAATVTSVEGLATHIGELDITDVMLLEGELLDELYPAGLDHLEGRGITVLLRVRARDTVLGLKRLRQVGGLPFVVLRSQSIPRSRAQFKRLFDLVLVLATAPAWGLVLGLVALYQSVVVGRPLLYRQTRIGARGRSFELVKFRTMTVDAEDDGLGARLAEPDDPRVIRGCRWIRAMRLDELPQIWNVLTGEMSLVGPRPERPELVEAFERDIPGYHRRNELRPGLTGLAQIHGRYHTDAEYKLGYDLQYLVNWSPVLDLQILFRTVWVVVAQRI